VSSEVLIVVLTVLIVAALMVGLTLLFVRNLKADQSRFTATSATAAQYGLRPGPLSVPWLPYLPDHGSGFLRQSYAGQSGGRPVQLAEYRYKTASGSGTFARHNVAVAAVQLRAPHPPRSGQGRACRWQVAGAYVLAWHDGDLAIPAILPTLDELLAVAAWLEPAG